MYWRVKRRCSLKRNVNTAETIYIKTIKTFKSDKTSFIVTNFRNHAQNIKQKSIKLKTYEAKMMKKVFNDLALYDVHQNRNEKKLDIYVPL